MAYSFLLAIGSVNVVIIRWLGWLRRFKSIIFCSCSGGSWFRIVVGVDGSFGRQYGGFLGWLGCKMGGKGIGGIGIRVGECPVRWTKMDGQSGYGVGFLPWLFVSMLDVGLAVGGVMRDVWENPPKKYYCVSFS